MAPPPSLEPAVRPRRVRVIALLVLALLSLAAASRANGDAAKPASPGEAVYQTACATCHGPRGTGAPRRTVGFDLPLPDLTDCSFSTREPDQDWGAVIHDGGPARGFSELMPAFGDALAGEQIDQVLEYLRALCTSRDWPRGELNLPRPMVTEKAFPEDEVVLTMSAATEGSGSISEKLVYERRLGARSQVEFVAPYSAFSEDGGWTAGFGDVAVGFKRALYHSLRRGSIFSVTGEVVLPTGDHDEELGKGTAVFEPFVTFGQILPRDSFVQAQVGIELPIDTDRAPQEAFWRAAVGKSFTQGRFGRTWSPMVELLGARELVDDEAVQWDVLPQVQVTLSTRQHIMANVGVRVPLTDSGPRTTQLYFYLLWDWFDGGLLQGW